MYLVILISPLRSFRVQFFRPYNLLPSPLQILINSTPPPFSLSFISLSQNSLSLSLSLSLTVFVFVFVFVWVSVCSCVWVVFGSRCFVHFTLGSSANCSRLFGQDRLSLSLFSSISLIHERIYNPSSFFSFLFLLFMALSFAS